MTIIQKEITNGVALIGSDGHIWPGPFTPAMNAFIQIAEILQPDLCILNGDMLDGATISRHPPLGFEKLPTLAEELEANQIFRQRLEQILPAHTDKLHTRGNHEDRFEVRLAMQAREYEGVVGFLLEDHVVPWVLCQAVWINKDVYVIHRYHSGEHAAYNNTVKGGATVVTGHTHRLLAKPYYDLRQEVRYGVETGFLANYPHNGGKQSAYVKGTPTNWQPGCVVLSWENGKLQTPELVTVDIEKGTFRFRGRTLICEENP